MRVSARALEPRAANAKAIETAKLRWLDNPKIPAPRWSGRYWYNALNNSLSNHRCALASEAHRSGERIGVPLAGDDKAAVDVPKQLVSDARFKPVVVGGLSTAKRFDPGTPA
jgi:hypothetical protein